MNPSNPFPSVKGDEISYFSKPGFTNPKECSILMVFFCILDQNLVVSLVDDKLRAKIEGCFWFLAILLRNIR